LVSPVRAVAVAVAVVFVAVAVAAVADAVDTGVAAVAAAVIALVAAVAVAGFLQETWVDTPGFALVGHSIVVFGLLDLQPFAADAALREAEQETAHSEKSFAVDPSAEEVLTVECSLDSRAAGGH
jgi:hypothetical protein